MYDCILLHNNTNYAIATGTIKVLHYQIKGVAYSNCNEKINNDMI